MKRRTFCAILPIAATLPHVDAAIQQQPPRERLLFDNDWRFLLGDASGTEAMSYDVSTWRSVDLPHDWSIKDKILDIDRLPAEPRAQ